MKSKVDDKTCNALGSGYFVIDKLLPWNVPGFSVRFSQDVLPTSTLLSKYSLL